MSRSEIEDDFADQLNYRKLPPYHREFRFARDVGRQFPFDFAWSKYKVAAEIDGFKCASVKVPAGSQWRMQTVIVSGHGTPTRLHEDAEKRNLAALLGWSVLVFHEKDVVSGLAVDTLIRMLVVKGWKGAASPIEDFALEAPF